MTDPVANPAMNGTLAEGEIPPDQAAGDAQAGIQPAKLQRWVARGAIGSFLLKGSAAGLMFAMNLVAARLLTAAEFGGFTTALAWIAILSFPATIGLDFLVLKKVSVYVVRGDWAHLRGLLLTSTGVVLAAATVLGGVLYTGSVLAASHLDPTLVVAYGFAAAILPFVALTRVWRFALQGMNKIFAAQAPELLLLPGGFLLLIVVAGVSAWPLGIWNTMGLYMAAAVTACVISAALLRARLPPAVRQADSAFDRHWLGAALPMWLVSGLHMIILQTDVIMLGMLAGPEAAGIYGAAAKVCLVVSLVIIAVNEPLAPAFARLHSENQHARMQALITRTARYVLFLSAPLALGLVLFAGPVLSLFGPGFEVGSTALSVLVIGQMVNATMGSVAILLLMTGHAADAAKGIGIGAVLNIVLNMILIPLWNLEGAAIANTVSVVVWNIWLVIAVRRRLGMDSTAFGHWSSNR